MLDNDEFEVKANMGLVMRGGIGDLDILLTNIKQLAKDVECQIIFKEVSADRLWISREEESK